MQATLERAIAATREAEFATLTPSGQPIANPLFHYFQPGDPSIDVATGLAYPAKAERARANPKVGLLISPAVHAYDPIAMLEQGPPRMDALADSPVIVIAACAAVRDADIQSNTDRYVKLFIAEHPKIGPAWEDVRGMLHYWARIWVECVPAKILYWPTGRVDREAPRVWRAPEDISYPVSDSAPTAPPTPMARWPSEDWRTRAARVLEQFPQPVLTAVDEEGFPLPFPMLAAKLTKTGFNLHLPLHKPWPASGKACLSFGALATFVGTLRGEAFDVARVLGDLPNIFAANDDQLATLRGRLESELQRRGQSMPVARRSSA